jgi:hypothetical protein
LKPEKILFYFEIFVFQILAAVGSSLFFLGNGGGSFAFWAAPFSRESLSVVCVCALQWLPYKFLRNNVGKENIIHIAQRN